MSTATHLPADDRATLIARNVRRAMREQHVTGVRMARALNMSQAAWSRRETGTTPLTVDELWFVAEFLGLDPGWFYHPGDPLYTGPASSARSSMDRASDYGSVVRYNQPGITRTPHLSLTRLGVAA
jgi:transcriptional regulator with XRE-family HTH domain